MGVYEAVEAISDMRFKEIFYIHLYCVSSTYCLPAQWKQKLKNFFGSIDRYQNQMGKMGGQSIDSLVGLQHSNEATAPDYGRDGHLIGVDTVPMTQLVLTNGKGECRKKDSKDCIKITGLRVSCESDFYKPNKDYVGVFVHDAGTYNQGLSHGRIYAGYIMFFETTNSVKKFWDNKREAAGHDEEGTVHGYAVWRRFRRTPSELMQKYGMKFSGFAIRQGRTRFNSGTLNSADVWVYQNREMVPAEQYIISAAIEAWKQNGRARTYWTDWNKKPSILPYICDAIYASKSCTVEDFEIYGCKRNSCR